jgi:hypothetical protein
MIALSNAFAPFIGGPGLFVSVDSGNVINSGANTFVPAATLSLPANSTVYVYLNTSSFTFSTSTSGFPSTSCYPIAVVTTGSSGVLNLTDSRPDVGGVGGFVPTAINAQIGTSYPIQNSDQSALVTFNNTSAVAVTLAQAGSSNLFQAGWWCYVKNKNTGLVTITPTTSTISGFPQIVLAKNQWALIISDGTNYEAFFTKIASPSAASALSAYLTTDAGTGAAGNQIVVQDLSAGGVNLLRKALNIYLETAAQAAGTNYDGFQVNVGATISGNTSASVGHVEAAEFSVAASGSTVTLPQINAVKTRVSVLAGTTVTNVISFLSYLPSIAGTATNYAGFELDSPTGSGSVTNYTGISCALNLNNISVTNSFGASLGGGTNATGSSAAIILDNSTVNSGAIVWGQNPSITNGIYSGSGSPNGVVTANPGSLYLNTSGGSGTTLYVKESGSGTNTGWVGK